MIEVLIHSKMIFQNYYHLSNAIVLAKNKQLLASGVGQTSRVDALKHAIEKAKSFEFDLQGSVMASKGVGAWKYLCVCAGLCYNCNRSQCGRD